MQSLFRDYVERFETFVKDFKKTIAGLTVEALDWVPGPEMNSLTVLVVHTMGAARFWIGDMGLGDLSERDRAAEFQAKGYTEVELVALLDDTFAYVAQALARLTYDDLMLTRQSPIHQREYSVSWSLLHALEHTALHIGHAQITRQLWDQRG
ncbi:MAG: DUF664 domain-containing protein [Chloroflexota bacterium]